MASDRGSFDRLLQAIGAPRNLAPRVVDDAIATLNDRQRYVLAMRFGYPGSPLYSGPRLMREEAGKRLRVTRERIRQIENKALLKLRAILNPNGPAKEGGNGEVDT